MTISLGGIAALVAGLVLILKKGALGGLWILLALAVVLFLVSILSAIVNRK